MTRFMITLNQAVDLVWKAFADMEGGELYVRKIPSMRVVDIAHCINEKARFEFIGIRPGEKLHEQMITADKKSYIVAINVDVVMKIDAMHTYEYDEYYKIIPPILNAERKQKRIKDGIQVPPDFCYASNTNTEWMSIETLRAWLADIKNNILV